MKRIVTVNTRNLTESVKKGGCGECQTSCQSACKTSCKSAVRKAKGWKIIKKVKGRRRVSYGDFYCGEILWYIVIKIMATILS